MKFIRTFLLFILLAPVLHNQAQSQTPKKPYIVSQGDKAFSLFDFHTAIDCYKTGLKKKNADTVYCHQQIADAYRQLNDPLNEEIWYSKLVKEGSLKGMNKYWYAEALRENQKYEEAKKMYLEYKATAPDDQNVDEILKGIDNLRELAKDKGVFKVQNAGPVNSSASDFGPAFYTDGQIFFTSNRNGKQDNNLIDNWSTRNYYQIFLASPDSGTSNISRVKTIGSCKPNGKFHDGPVVFYPQRSELMFTRSNYKNATSKTAKDKKTVNLQLFSMVFPKKKSDKLVAMPFNDKEFSNAHPALSADGNTLYFSSDRPGGFGGTDLYSSERSSDGKWGEPKNLGAEVNTKYDEKFPFLSAQGILYYSSNALDGLGGLDIYMTKLENGAWAKPENVGAPVNSNRDDFTFVMDSANKTGFFASNRDGGAGDDDIYSFTYDETKLDYKLTVRVIDANTKQPIDLATLALECKGINPQNTLTDAKGEHVFVLKGGRSCTIDALKDGYKPGVANVTSKDRGKTIIIELVPDIIKLIVRVKEKSTLEPIRDVAVSLVPKGAPAMNYATGDMGHFQTEIPSGEYAVSSADFASITGSFTDKDADANGVVVLEYLIPREELVVNVPLTANCFSSAVTVTDLTTGYRMDVQPNTNGEVRLDLRLNRKYLVEHNGRLDTISTVGLKPGDNIEGPCKFHVGQTWIIRNIYYDLDKFYIRPDAAKELDNLVRVMRENPTLEIELSSHTDCRQTMRYNMILSARRARSAVEYIVKKKINAKRIIAAGYGETVLTNACACEPTNESNCNNDQHQANRRTEVKVLRY